MNENELIEKLKEIYPLESGEDWDYQYYQIGQSHPKRKVKKIFLCLDFSEFCLDDCIKFKPDIIITHHPFIFGEKEEVLLNDKKKEQLIKEIESKLKAPIYSIHTSYDKAKGGMNDIMADIFHFKDKKIASDGLLRICYLDKKMDVKKLAKLILGFTSLNHIRFLQIDDKKFDKVGLIMGGASSDYKLALENNLHCFISGDSKLNTRLDMKRYNINYIELPHELEEIGFIQGMEKALLNIDPEFIINSKYYEKDLDVAL